MDEYVSEFIEILEKLAKTAGSKERTSIYPNAEIIDDSPSALPSNYIIVSSDQGYYIPAVKIPGVKYTTGDKVNLLIIEGTETIAFQHGSGSSGSPIDIALGDLSDVTTVGVNDNYFLKYDQASLYWFPYAPLLGDLFDVNTEIIGNNYFLKYSSGANYWFPDVVSGVGGGSVQPSICNGRLTLTTGTPITTSDTTGSTVYFTPFGGNTVSLYDGSAWVEYALSELSIAVPSTQWRLFDVFLYDNSGALALEVVNWNQPASALSISVITNTQPISVTTGPAHGLSTGNLIALTGVTVGNTAANGVWSVTVTGSTQFQLDFSQGIDSAWGISPKVWGLSTTRATALTTQDGILVKSGDTTRRYLGTGMTNNTSGQCEDSKERRFLFNYYNRRNRALFTQDTTVHSYTTATARRFDNDGNLYTAWLSGLVENDTNPNIITNLENSSANTSQVRMYHNATLLQALAHGVVARLPLAFASVITPATGFNFLQSVALGNGADTSWRSTSLNGIIRG